MLDQNYHAKELNRGDAVCSGSARPTLVGSATESRVTSHRKIKHSYELRATIWIVTASRDLVRW